MTRDTIPNFDTMPQDERAMNATAIIFALIEAWADCIHHMFLGGMSPQEEDLAIQHLLAIKDITELDPWNPDDQDHIFKHWKRQTACLANIPDDIPEC